MFQLGTCLLSGLGAPNPDVYQGICCLDCATRLNHQDICIYNINMHVTLHVYIYICIYVC